MRWPHSSGDGRPACCSACLRVRAPTGSCTAAPPSPPSPREPALLAQGPQRPRSLLRGRKKRYPLPAVAAAGPPSAPQSAIHGSALGPSQPGPGHTQAPCRSRGGPGRGGPGAVLPLPRGRPGLSQTGEPPTAGPVGGGSRGQGQWQGRAQLLRLWGRAVGQPGAPAGTDGSHCPRLFLRKTGRPHPLYLGFT